MLRLLVALDFSDCSREALRTALQIAQRAAVCELVLFTVLDDNAEPLSEHSVNEQEGVTTTLHKLVEEESAKIGFASNTVKMHYASSRGSAADEIIAQASTHNADAIVMGTHGRTGFNRLIAGSVAEKVVRLAPCSVLAVRVKR